MQIIQNNYVACISIVATASSSSETASGSGETATSPSHISTSRGSTHTADDRSSSDTTQTSNGSLSSDQNASTLPFLAHPGVSNDNFRCVMSSRRFESLLQFIHINDSRKQPAAGEPGYDKLYKIRPLLNILLKNYRDSYTPSEYISIDESMIGFKGRLAFLQYMPKKPQKWGMKAWVLADSNTGYTWSWKLYTGKESEPPQLGLAHRVVLELVDDPRILSL